MNRDTQLQNLRPILIFEKQAETTLEKFQNDTLRPILKLQNDLLIQVFTKYCQQRKGLFFKLSDKDKLIYIDQNIRKDMKFKHYLEGIITGHFTLDEYQLFLNHEEELTKRMIHLLIQRLQSQLLLLTM
ncbi:glyoxalase [Arcicella rigui]|uniref:Glyoxalase n=1 Tax=Arcicella rigui TaxID=797020 RepID=A0ABU5QFB1_9BACT|nr:glyoxalase [Arcicella rigui]MEA5141317.1 glyoxalase [Arcicella rigui]